MASWWSPNICLEELKPFSMLENGYSLAGWTLLIEKEVVNLKEHL